MSAGPATEFEAKPLLWFDLVLPLAVRADHTASVPFGSNDLSGPDLVFRGRYMAPINGNAKPFVAISAPVVPVSDTNGTPINCYNKQAVYDVIGFAPYVRPTGEGGNEIQARTQAAIRLMHDVTYAIEESGRGPIGPLTLNNNACFRDVSVESRLLDGDEWNLPPGYGVFFSTVTISYTIRRGV